MKKGKPEKGPSWQERNMEANKAARQAVDADMDERCGGDITRRLASVPVATDEEVIAASKVLNDAMGANPNPKPKPNPNLTPNPKPDQVLNDAMGAALRDIDPAARSFFKLFNRMDDDGSGKAAYVEFESLIRVDMHVTKQELPTRQVAHPHPNPNPNPSPNPNS